MVKIILLLIKIVIKSPKDSIVLIAGRATEKSFQVFYESYSMNYD